MTLRLLVTVNVAGAVEVTEVAAVRACGVVLDGALACLTVVVLAGGLNAFLLAVIVLTRGSTCGAWELLLPLEVVDTAGTVVGADDDARVFLGAFFAYNTATRKHVYTRIYSII